MFVVSGVWHELILDVPFYLFCGINVLGGWIHYFAIQTAGMVVERLLFPERNMLGVVFAWAVILVPAPLALNQATLATLWLSVGPP